VVEEWISDVLQAPFATSAPFSTLSLAQLKAEQCVVEMEFHLPLHQVNGSEFNRIVNLGRSTVARQYGFESLNGMLKGFIDLTFEYQGQYFVADYKSNFLGDSADDYAQNKLQRAMDEHDYGLQAILYVLALHRLLKLNLADYDYEKHIGGAFYLFLRGMSAASPGNGCYFVKPEQSLIDALDRLFDGEQGTQPRQDMEQLKLC
jgi:exodeoxyribonuclease V beta subunit